MIEKKNPVLKNWQILHYLEVDYKFLEVPSIHLEVEDFGNEENMKDFCIFIADQKLQHMTSKIYTFFHCNTFVKEKNGIAYKDSTVNLLKEVGFTLSRHAKILMKVLLVEHGKGNHLQTTQEVRLKWIVWSTKTSNFSACFLVAICLSSLQAINRFQRLRWGNISYRELSWMRQWKDPKTVSLGQLFGMLSVLSHLSNNWLQTQSG